jgi:signal peptidase
MRKLNAVKDITLVVFAILFATSAILSIYFQAGFLTITSRSMEPTIKAGDMVLTRLIPTSEIQNRDIVVLPLPEDKSIRYSHRVISIERKAGNTFVRTQGDANPNPDQWTLGIEGKEVTKVMAVIPTAAIFSGPIDRRWIYYGLFYGGAILGLYGSWRLLKR